ncbi:MAG: hypothetical protein MOP50_494, partial [Nitrososphaera sp.]|nr:hypothetical protein [Nitrososphaera sp.]
CNQDKQNIEKVMVVEISIKLILLFPLIKEDMALNTALEKLKAGKIIGRSVINP